MLRCHLSFHGRSAAGTRAARLRGGLARRVKAAVSAFLAAAACGWWLAVGVGTTGCATPAPRTFRDSDLAYYEAAALEIATPAGDLQNSDGYAEIAATPHPRTLDTSAPQEYWDLTLQEAVHLALQNSKVLRDLGGAVLRAPESVNTIQSPAIQDTDPRFGVEGALAAFDASWETELFFEKNDRALNNEFFGGGTRMLTQDLIGYNSELVKRSAVGTQMAARHRIDYDFNNAPGNNTPNLPWLTMLEVEARQPLLQGGGVDFNRIAGPGAVPGVYNGVMIARINTDISLADFEAGVRDLVADVETAYWELYFAYRNLDSRVAARDRALQTWAEVQSMLATGRRGGERATEARAREQYFRLEGEVQNALSGRSQERSRTTTLRGAGGVYNNERQLRLLMGAPINDVAVIRPVSEPLTAQVRFDWSEILAESLQRRVELRRQQWKIKRRELELLAAKNHLLPQLDVFGRYRWRGLGHNLLEPNGTDRPEFHDAFQNLFDGDYQEWQTGLEFSLPIGFRQAHAAVRNAELNLHREMAIFAEQQREIALELSNAVAEKDRAYLLAQTSLNRRIAAQEELAATAAIFGPADDNQRARLLDLLLDSQRRLAEADIEYHRSLVEYMMAIRQLHYAKGSLLDYNGVYLSEGPWPHEAYADARERFARRVALPRLDHHVQRAPIVSAGAHPQRTLPPPGDYAPPVMLDHPLR